VLVTSDTAPWSYRRSQPERAGRRAFVPTAGPRNKEPSVVSLGSRNRLGIMPHTVEIYTTGAQATLLGVGTLEDARFAGEYSSLLRPPPELPGGRYVLRFASGERWAVEILSAPDPRASITGPYVTAAGSEPRPR